MDFSLSDEQRQLQDSVGRFVRDRYPFEQWRKITDTPEGFAGENWRQMAELDWLGVSLPEEAGGLGGSPVDTMVILEGIGRGLVAEPYLSTVVLGGGFLVLGGTPEMRERELPKLAAGDLKLAFAHAETQSRFSLEDVVTSAKAAGGGYVLNGRKIVVYDAPAADKLIVSARTGGAGREREGISLFLIDRDAPGVHLRAYRTLDRRRAADVTLEKVAVDAGALIGVRDQALPLIEQVVDHAIAALAAESVGAMQLLTETTTEYLKTRKQFGQPIGNFQALQHRMVDILIATEQARSMSYMVTMKLDRPARERSRAAAAAKVQIGQSGRFVGQQAIQLHGGMGMSDELNVGHFAKRLMMIDMLYGNADHHRQRFIALE
mgnify:FL=1